MHLSLMAIAFGLALLLRLCWTNQGSWQQRWHKALRALIVPPLLLLTSTLAVLCMGRQGTMLGLEVGAWGYSIAVGFLVVAGGLLIHLGWQGWRSLKQLQSFSLVKVGGNRGRLLDSDRLFAAQVGFWHSELVVSRGLLHLDAAHLNAVVVHEQAHHYYRDTFWFFWLGWCRRLSAWLPQTEPLWQELLLLRELRADCWAAQRVDALLLAESLLLMVKAPLVEAELAALSAAAASATRLEERIEALLSPEETTSEHQLWWLVLGLLPLLTVLLHK